MIKEYVISLWRGNVKLWITFWIYGFFIKIVLSLTLLWFDFFTLRGLINSPSAMISLPLLSLVSNFIEISYTIFTFVAIWRSSGNYEGWRGWKYAARFTVILLIVLNIFVFILDVINCRGDVGKDSYNIESLLEKDEKYPYIGFWKEDCNHDFGLAISKSKCGNGFYSVSFCGPGGCFKPGTYRPDTTLLNDPSYIIVDDNTIKVGGLDGFSSYHRCEQFADDSADSTKERNSLSEQ